MDKITHHGSFRDRLSLACEQTVRERAFADQWEKENSVFMVLDGLLCCAPDPEGHSISGLRRLRDLTQEDATNAATVIQWLGSSVGFSFLGEALSRAG